jgi:phosphoadenosine phosphosulfate reductase
MFDIHEKNQTLPAIEQKVDISRGIIEKSLRQFPGNDLCIAWTGGKDSTTMLWLYRMVCSELDIPIPRTMFIDEGDVFEEIREFVIRLQNEWQIDVEIVKNTDVSEKASEIGDIIKAVDLNELNRTELDRIGFKEDRFPFEPESFIGNHLMKTVPMKSFLRENRIKALSTAIRWDEQEARTKEEYFSPRTDPEHIRVHPILHFNERDIWKTIQKFDIPFCSLYYKGYRSLGAECSTIKTCDIPAWEQDFENTPERAGRGQDKEQVMQQLRTLGYM